MSRLLWIMFLLVCLPLALLAQPQPDTLWTALYGLENVAEYQCYVGRAPDGGLFVVASQLLTAYDTDIVLLHYDAHGNLLWSRSYGGFSHDRAFDACATPDGGLMIAGQTSTFGAGALDAYLVRTDSQGDTLWTRTYGLEWYDGARAVSLAPGDQYLVTGFAQHDPSFNYDIFAMKIDGDGELLWELPVEGPLSDEGVDILSAPDSGAIVIGNYYVEGLQGYRTYIGRLSPDGVLERDSLYSWPGYRDPVKALIGPDNTLLIAGRIGDIGGVYALDSTGNVQWTHTYGGLAGSYVTDIVADSFGGYFVAGSMFVPPHGNDLYLTSLDSQGVMEWRVFYGGDADENGSELCLTADGCFVLCGNSDMNDSFHSDIYVVRTGPLGPNSVEDRIISVPSALQFSTYPNPFNAVTTISFTLPQAGNVQIEVLDLLGRRVAELMDRPLDRGAHSVRFDGATLSSGLYFVRLSAGSVIQTQKVMLLK